MGLDMYLTASRYCYEAGIINDKKITVLLDDKPLKASVCNIVCRAAYWRKANAIHNWFVQNVQCGEDNCEEHNVSRDQLKALMALCRKALKTGKFDDALPPVSGFFFGDTENLEYYLAYLKDTVAQITKALRQFPEKDGWEFIYQSSW